MRTFNHNELDYLIDNWRDMTTTRLYGMLKGKHFIFKGDNPQYKGRVFIIEEVTSSLMGVNVHYRYAPHRSSSPYAFPPRTLATDMSNFVKQIQGGTRVPFDDEWK